MQYCRLVGLLGGAAWLCAWDPAGAAAPGRLLRWLAVPALLLARACRGLYPGSRPSEAAAAAGRQAVPDLLAQRYGDRLSSRDLEICRLALLGVAPADIARQVDLAEPAVRARLHRICRRTGAADPGDLYRRLVDPRGAG